MASTAPGRQRFSAPWSTSLLLTTVLVVTLVCGAAVAVAVTTRLHPAMAGAGAMAVLGLAWALAPTGFAVDEERLVILRRVRPVVVRRNDIRSVRVLSEFDARALGISGALRRFGVGGVFGYYGSFSSTPLGRFRMYATRLERFVLVETVERKLVLTPDEPNELRAALAREPKLPSS